MGKGDYEAGESPKDLYREARNMARRSTSFKEGPTQSDVVRRYASAVEKFVQRGDFYKARQILKEVKEFTDDSELIEIIRGKLEQAKARLPGEKKDIGGRFIFATLSITSLLSALFFTSISLTGYSVFELTENNSRFVGTGLFILGLVFVFLYFKLK